MGLWKIGAWALSGIWLASGALAQVSPGPAAVEPRLEAEPKGKTPTSSDFHEEWSTITLTGSNLKAQPPVLGGKDDLPQATYTKETYQVQWRPSDPIDLYVVLPKGVKKPPVILYLYSFPQDSDRFKDDTWCTIATSGGYAAVGFVSAFTGHRVNGTRPMKEWFVSELQEALSTSTHDVQMILNFLAGRGDLAMERVGMFGQGSGGSIAILASAADPRIRAIDVLTPWGDWPNWLAKSAVVPLEERAKYTAAEFLARVAPLDPVVWLPKVKAQTVRIQNVRHDPITPDESQLKIEAATPEIAEINQFGDGGALVPKAAGGRLFDWLKAELKADSAPQTVAEKSDRIHFFPPVTKPKGQP